MFTKNANDNDCVDDLRVLQAPPKAREATSSSWRRPPMWIPDSSTRLWHHFSSWASPPLSASPP